MTAVADRLHIALGSRRLPLLLLWLLLAACAVVAVRLAWLLVAGPSLPLEAPPAQARLQADQRQPLASLGLFGAAPAAGTPATSVPVSTSSLRLSGVLAGDDPERGVALIAEGDGAQRHYRVGDSLPGGARLQAVYPDHVQVSRGGASERIDLPRGGLREPARARRDARPVAPAGAAGAVAASGGFLTAAPSIGRPSLATARAQAAPDLAALAEGANIVPVLDGDRVVGVRLRLSDPTVLERLGLSAEDVITEVNGIALDGPQRRAELEASLTGGGPVRLTVRRDGVDRQLTIGL